MQFSEQYYEKLSLFKKSVKMEDHARTPMVSNFFTWKVLDSEYDLGRALRDYDVMREVVCGFHERYGFDAYFELGDRNQINIPEALGSNHYSIDSETGAINFVDAVLMEDDEYRLLTQDPGQFSWTMFNRKYPDANIGQLLDALKAMNEGDRFRAEMTEKFLFDYSCPGMTNGCLMAPSPIDSFINFYRGIKNGSIDLRRRKSEVKEACDFIFETQILPVLNMYLEKDDSDYIFGVQLFMLAHGVLNRKQFEEFYWPYLSKAINLFVENDRTVCIYCENSILRFADFFQDIPKGYVTIQHELDDPFELRKALPNICISGGMNTELLGNGTPKECVDYAKRLIDGMGPGFIMSQNKMVSFKNDCRRENLLAVNDFVRNYQL